MLIRLTPPVCFANNVAIVTETLRTYTTVTVCKKHFIVTQGTVTPCLNIVQHGQPNHRAAVPQGRMTSGTFKVGLIFRTDLWLC
ncbi:hypothetical protein RvY_06309-7 [Ramazzottius varieornatus]|uniref:Uncharacterized protein n=1 Tax=Ramazzottius varieornatus TaxID=947166 RepID=A0A1D1UY25_RAMVA|nr:hypothetical protein RvY_06309-7 [Ramazzottius varieornatus]